MHDSACLLNTLFLGEFVAERPSKILNRHVLIGKRLVQEILDFLMTDLFNPFTEALLILRVSDNKTDFSCSVGDRRLNPLLSWSVSKSGLSVIMCSPFYMMHFKL